MTRTRALSDIAADLDSVRARVLELDTLPDPTPDEADEAERLMSRFEALQDEHTRAVRVQDIRSRAMNPRSHEGSRPVSTGFGDDLQTRARRLVDVVHRSDELSDEAAQRVDGLLTASGVPDEARTRTARWVTATGSDAYRSAVTKLMADPLFGHRAFTNEEATAFGEAEAVRRAMSLLDSAGGFLVPFHLDPAIMLTNAGSVNPLRQVSRVVSIGTDVWHGVTSAGVTAEWLAESAQVADASPSFASPDVKPEKAAAWVQGSFEVLADSGFASQLGMLLADAKDQLEAVAFMTGDGVGKPEGVMTGVSAVSGSRVATASTGAFASQDVYALQQALPPRHQARARWMANLSTLNKIDQMETSNGSKLFPDLGAGSMLRHPVHEASVMNATVSAGNDIALYGDFQQYLIVDRIGSTLVHEPLVKGANGRPTGEAGWFMYFRTGGAVLNSDAFRVLRVKA